jgi:hypothetical protein
MSDKNYEGDKQVFNDEKSAKKALEEENGAFCFDCNCNIHLEEEEIKNGSLLAYEEEEGEFFVFKCDDCFAKNKGLEDYKKCEVYSRIVGYLRPVNQWNDGKKREYEERKEYKPPTDN